MNILTEAVEKSTRNRILLGNLLLADGLILPQDLELALDHQIYTRQLLGEILVRIGALKKDDLEKMLQLQRGL